VQQVGAQAAQLGRDRDVLGQAVPARILHHGHEVLGQVAQRGLVRAVAEKEIRRLAVEVGEVTHEVADVRTDPVVAPLARVDRDLHGAA
jgi:hypothetical protein